MTSDRWLQIKSVFQAAVELDSERRQILLREMCGSDAELRREVESLLSAAAGAGDFISKPVIDGSALADLHHGLDPMIGTQVGAYRIERQIGRGGMGTVYLASRVDRESAKPVAIKMISRGMDTESVMRRFLSERQILAHLDHPNISRLLDGATTDEGLPYFVMEYVAGLPVDVYCDRLQLSTDDRLKLFVEACSAVAYAHKRRVVHRDIKPGNILVTEEGSPKLLDFGIARILNAEFSGSHTTGGLMMTPAYASPEQISGGNVTAASDVYSLGVVLYRLLTGHSPYRTLPRTSIDLARAICDEEPEPPSRAIDRTEVLRAEDGTETWLNPEIVSSTRDGDERLLRRRLSGALDDIVLMALGKQPEDRYSSVSEFSEEIKRHLAGQPLAIAHGRAQRSFASTARDLWRKAWHNAASRQRPNLSPTTSESATASSTRTKGPERRRVVAVPHFQNLSAEPESEWLSTALPEMFITELAAGEQLRIVPSETVARTRLDLGLANVDSSPEALARLTDSLSVDILVTGSFVVLKKDGGNQIRIDLRIHDAADADILNAISETGREADLMEIISRAGRQLRRRIGVAAGSERTRAGFPTDPKDARLLAEGLQKLLAFDAIGAQPLLESAIKVDPDNALAHSALAQAWQSLGYEARAAHEAGKAYELAGNLSREEKLSIEGRYWESQKQWDKAIDIYRRLWVYFSDNSEYGLRLAAAQKSGSKGTEALLTIASVRKVDGADRDPRVDLAEAEAAESISDYKRAEDASRRAVDQARSRGSRLLITRALLALGRAQYLRGNPESAKDILEEAKRLALAVGDRAGISRALSNLAIIYDDAGETAVATELYREVIDVGRRIGDLHVTSSALNNLGILLKDKGKLAEGLESHQQALSIRREMANQSLIAVSLNNIGVICFEQDRLADAVEHYQESLTISRQAGDRRSAIRAQHNLSIALMHAGDLEEAKRNLEESLDLRTAIEDKRGMVIGLISLTHLLYELGETDGAKRSAERVLSLAREVHLRQAEGEALFALGEIALTEGDLATARQRHEAALAIRREIDELRTVAESYVALSRLSLAEGQPQAASELARSVLKDMEVEIGAPVEAVARVSLACALLDCGQIEEAEETIARARLLTSESVRFSVRIMVDITSARVQAALGARDAAVDRLNAILVRIKRTGSKLLEAEAQRALKSIT